MFYINRAFENQFTATSSAIAGSGIKSTVFIKKLLAVAISNVAYLRAIMTEESFSDRCEYCTVYGLFACVYMCVCV